MPSVTERQLEADRQLAIQRGNEINQDARDRRGVRDRQAGYYEDYANEAFDPLIGGRGGYSAEEQERIRREEETRSGMTRPDEYEGNYLTPEEQSGVRGRPWDRAAWFDSDAMMADQSRSEVAQREAATNYGRGLSSSFDPNRLRVSDDYGRSTDATLGGTESRVRGAIDPARLRTSDAVVQDIQMSPEERERIVTGAGITAGVGRRAALDQIEQRARASGSGTLGLAAVRDDYERSAAAESGDAETLARIRADAAQRDATVQGENLRRSGEQGYTDRVVAAETDLGRTRLTSGDARERLRMTGEADVADRTMRTADASGRAVMDTERDINQQGRQVSQYTTDTGTAIATGIERDAADRERAIAGNRQDTGRTNQQQRFDQTGRVVDDLSRREGAIADARRDDMREGRGYLTDRIAAGERRADYETNRGDNNYATQGQMQQSTTNARMQYDNRPRWWERAANAAAGIAGAVAPMFTGMPSGGAPKPTR